MLRYSTVPHTHFCAPGIMGGIDATVCRWGQAGGILRGVCTTERWWHPVPSVRGLRVTPCCVVPGVYNSTAVIMCNSAGKMVTTYEEHAERRHARRSISSSATVQVPLLSQLLRGTLIKNKTGVAGELLSGKRRRLASSRRTMVLLLYSGLVD